MKNQHQKVSSILGAMFCSVFATMLFFSCSDTVDESNMFISTESTMLDYLSSNEKYSNFVYILGKVKLSNNANASTLSSVLSARGNYTCFVPTNESVMNYLDSISAVVGLDPLSSIEEISDSDAVNIAKSCIIDCGDAEAYETSEFPTAGTFANANLNDRALTVVLDANTGLYFINSSSYVKNDAKDIEVSNGYLHEVTSVISPTSNTVPVLISNTDNMQIMGHLLEVTTLKDSMMKYRDDVYEATEHEDKINSKFGGKIPKHRYHGFTGFVETDSVFQNNWAVPDFIYDDRGIVSNWTEIVNYISDKAAETYTNGSEDYSNSANALNQFVSYHFCHGAFPYNKFVHHYNEFGYQYGDVSNPQWDVLSIDMSSYLSTLGKGNRLLKITHVAADREMIDGRHPMRLNRKALYNNGPKEDYTQKGSAIIPGVYMRENNGDQDINALNGYIYPIDEVLLYDKNVVNIVLNDRMRIDLAFFLHELITNNMRSNAYWGCPNGFFDNLINSTAETQCNYLCSDIYGSGGWHDYSGDEFLFTGVFDFTLRLPAVPTEGTYEIRMGCANNPARGMAQTYFGENPNALVATGLPVDLRQGANNNPNIPWVADVSDQGINIENDKNLRNQGWMKAPRFYGWGYGKGDTQARNDGGTWPALRYIVTRQKMEPGKNYYVRFKSALEKTDAEFFLDYFEFVPKSIYANEASPEDQW